MIYDDLENFCIENRIDLTVFNKNKKGEINHSRLSDNYGNFLLDVFFKYKKSKVLFNSILIWKTGVYVKINSLNELSNLLNSIYNLSTLSSLDSDTLF